MIAMLKRFSSRVFAVALLIGAACLVYALIIAPLSARFFGVRTEIGEQRLLLGKLTAAAARAGMERESAGRPAFDSDGAAFLAGGSDALRLAELQSLAAKAAEAEGIQIKSTRALPSRERDGLRLLGIEAQLSARVEQLQRILFKLESGRPLLLVETLQISAPPLLSDDNPAAGAMLDVRLGLLGAASSQKGASP